MAESNGQKFADFQKLNPDGKQDYLYMEQVRMANTLERLESKIGFTTALYGFLGGAVPVLILLGIKWVFGGQ